MNNKKRTQNKKFSLNNNYNKNDSDIVIFPTIRDAYKSKRKDYTIGITLNSTLSEIESKASSVGYLDFSTEKDTEDFFTGNYIPFESFYDTKKVTIKHDDKNIRNEDSLQNGNLYSYLKSINENSEENMSVEGELFEVIEENSNFPIGMKILGEYDKLFDEDNNLFIGLEVELFFKSSELRDGYLGYYFLYGREKDTYYNRREIEDYEDLIIGGGYLYFPFNSNEESVVEALIVDFNDNNKIIEKTRFIIKNNFKYFYPDGKKNLSSIIERINHLNDAHLPESVIYSRSLTSDEDKKDNIILLDDYYEIKKSDTFLSFFASQPGFIENPIKNGENPLNLSQDEIDDIKRRIEFTDYCYEIEKISLSEINEETGEYLYSTAKLTYFDDERSLFVAGEFFSELSRNIYLEKYGEKVFFKVKDVFNLEYSSFNNKEVYRVRQYVESGTKISYNGNYISVLAGPKENKKRATDGMEDERVIRLHNELSDLPTKVPSGAISSIVGRKEEIFYCGSSKLFSNKNKHNFKISKIGSTFLFKLSSDRGSSDFKIYENGTISPLTDNLSSKNFFSNLFGRLSNNKKKRIFLEEILFLSPKINDDINLSDSYPNKGQLNLLTNGKYENANIKYNINNIIVNELVNPLEIYDFLSSFIKNGEKCSFSNFIIHNPNNIINNYTNVSLSFDSEEDFSGMSSIFKTFKINDLEINDYNTSQELKKFSLSFEEGLSNDIIEKIKEIKSFFLYFHNDDFDEDEYGYKKCLKKRVSIRQLIIQN